MGGKRIETILREFRARHPTPSVVAARVAPDRIDVAGSGASVEAGFAWFSCTKLVTAALALQLDAEGCLDLQAPVGRWLPELVAEGPSVMDLLRHRGGLPNPVPLGWLADARRPPLPKGAFFRRHGARPARRVWRKQSGPHRPHYSNLSYLAAGEVLERATGRDYRELVEDYVLTPLAMHRTGFGPSSGPRAEGHMVYGSLYDLVTWSAGARKVSLGRHGRWRRLGPARMEASAAGGLFGPVGEAGRFLQSWLTNSLSLPGASGHAAMRGFDGEPFGIGWWVGPASVHHGGTGLGFVAHFVLDPTSRLAAAAFANRSGAQGPDWPPLEALTRTLLRA